MTIQKQVVPQVLAEAIWPKPTLLRDVVLVLSGTVLVALIAQIEIPLFPVPITGQTFGVLLVGRCLAASVGR